MEKYLVTEKGGKWSGSVATKYTPPAGLFTQKASAIANQLASDSADLKQAMSRLNFYINRGGSNIDPKQMGELQKAKELLRKKFGA